MREYVAHGVVDDEEVGEPSEIKVVFAGESGVVRTEMPQHRLRRRCRQPGRRDLGPDDAGGATAGQYTFIRRLNCYLSRMVLNRFLPALLVFFTLAEHAIPQAPPEDLTTAIEQQVKAKEGLQARTAEAQAALQKWYHAALDAVKKNATAKGQLDDVLAVDAERERVERDLTPEEAGKLPPVVRGIRTQYDQARTQQKTQEKASLAASIRAYAATLESLEKRLTQKSDVPNAVLTRKERTAADEELKSLLAALTPP
ncbi:MAG TPA: hypothetical protein VGO11_20815, partial [Chthoniobacteraceae bacterium]|nr:hypothetical protein [Chthoniobacteraceae bacterium]